MTAEEPQIGHQQEWDAKSILRPMQLFHLHRVT